MIASVDLQSQATNMNLSTSGSHGHLMGIAGMTSPSALNNFGTSGGNPRLYTGHSSNAQNIPQN